MGLEVPDLDDRTYAALRDRARRRIPVHDEQWTDHNATDPGITLLELFAWIAETDIYRLDRLTDSDRRRFCRLVGVEPRPPRPATGRVRVAVGSEADGRVVPAGTRVTADVGHETTEPFEVAADTHLTAASVDAVVTVADGRTDHTRANDTEGLSYRAFGDDPAAGDALYLGFRDDPFDRADRLELTVAYHDADLPDPAGHLDESVAFEPSHRIRWEYYPASDDPEARAYGRWFDANRWTPFETVGPVEDITRSAYRGGRVGLPSPPSTADPAPLFDRTEPFHWLRARVARQPPPPPSPACDGRRPSPPPVHYEIPPQFAAIRTNVLPVVHGATSRDIALERHGGALTTARPGQTFRFDRRPIRRASIAVGGDRWTEVPDFAGSGPADRHYVLDRSAGTVTFGNGHQGAIPDPGQRVVATWVTTGGSTDGNLVGPTWRSDADELEATDLRAWGPTAGGRDAESIDATVARARRERDRTARAVTAADYRSIARATPGVRFGRVGVVADETPIRVVVVPYSPPDVRPEPSAGVLEAVDCHLQRHTLVTDDVDTVGPTYVPVEVTAAVVRDRGGPLDRRAAGTDAVRSLLDPLTGFDGDGWPFGRPIPLSEVYECLADVAGIATVVDVDLRVDGDLAAPTALPDLEAVRIRVVDEPTDCGGVA